MNVRQGELAFIKSGLDGPNDPQVGKVVTVVSFWGTSPKLGPIWNIEFPRPIRLIAARRDGTPIAPGGYRTDCQCPDAWLSPIRGGEVEDDPQAIEVPVPTSREAVPA